MPYKINSEQELLDIAKESTHILVNLRYFTAQWEETHGSGPKNKKNYWETRADEFIKKYELMPSQHSIPPQIEK